MEIAERVEGMVFGKRRNAHYSVGRVERRNLRAWDLGVLERSSRRGLKQVAEDNFCVPF